MKTKFVLAKKELKELLLTWQGWLAWFIANIFTSLHWAVPLIIGFIFKDEKFYTIAGTLYAIGLSPLVPLWLFNVFIAIFIKNKIFTKLKITR
jgi:hypothetical protein